MSAPAFRLVCPHNGELRPCQGCEERYGSAIPRPHRYEQLVTVSVRPSSRRHRCPDHGTDLVIAR
jgi:hypothetical protein